MKLNHLRLVALVAAAVSLAVPASAWAHGSVYTDIARVDTNPAPNAYTLADQTRHVVTNHGFTYLLRETNGAADQGMVDYSRLPGDYRAAIPPSQVLAEGDTGAQPHATCRGVAVLEAESAIRGWQEADPFYNYVPFQKVSAGLEDHPADWIQDVLALTGGGVDLAEVSDVPAQAATELAAKCAGLGGTFVPADKAGASDTATVASATRSFAEGLVIPLEEEIALFQANLAAAQSASAAQASAKSAAEKENAALKAQIAGLKASALSIEPVGKPTLGQLADRPQVNVTGPAGKSVTVRILARKAKALKLKSGVLAKATAKIRVDGTALVRLAPGGKAKAALKKAKSAGVIFEITSGDRTASTARTLSR